MKWETARLCDIANINMGQSPFSETYNQAQDGLPFYQGKADFGVVNPEVRMYCCKPLKTAKLNDVLMSVRAPVGSVNIADKKCCIGRGLSAISAIENISYYKYLFYFFKYVEKDIADMGVGSTFKAICRKDLETIQVPFPPVETQKQIAKALDKASELIEKRKQQIKLLDDFVKSVFIEMFGDPVTNPMGWEKGTIGTVCYFVKDGPHASPKYFEQGIPFITVNNIVNGYWDFSNIRYISEDDYNLYKKRCCPQMGDVLYTKGGTTGIAKYIDIDLKFINWVHIAVLKFNRDVINGRFFEHMLNTSYCYEQSQRYTRGIANRDLVLNQMKMIELYIPPVELQKEFAAIVEQTEKQKAVLNDGLEQTERNYKSIMQKAFNGGLH